MKELVENFKENVKIFFALGGDNEKDLLESLDKIFYSLNGLSASQFRETFAKVSHEIHELDNQASIALFTLFKRKLDAIYHIPKYSFKEIPGDEDQDIFCSFFEKCFAAGPREIRVKDFKIEDYYGIDKNVLFHSLNSFLQYCVQRELDPNDIDTDVLSRMMALVLSRNLCNELACSEVFYKHYNSIIERINLDGYSQQARDLAEDALLCSFDDERKEWGYLARFSLYAKQTNIVDALMNGCLLLTEVCNKPEISKELYQKFLFETFNLCRAVGFHQIAEDIYRFVIHDLEEGSYERQQFDMAYFNLLLLRGEQSLVSKVERYLKSNIDSVIGCGFPALKPWLVFLANLQFHFEKSFNESSKLLDYQNQIENRFDVSDVRSIKERVLLTKYSARKSLRNGLKKLSFTRNKSDAIFETNMLLVHASRAISEALSENDVETILLAHRLKSDAGIYFSGEQGIDSHVLKELSFFQDSDKKHIDDYLDYVSSALKEIIGTQFIWLGFDMNNIYYVLYDNLEFTSGILHGSSKLDLENWKENYLNNLCFDDSPTTDFMTTREDVWKKESESIIESLPDFILPISGDKNVVVFLDNDISFFPHNLIQCQTRELVSKGVGISNPLSIDLFISSSQEAIDLSEVGLWAPTVDSDNAILKALSKLQSELDQYCIQEFNELTPPSFRTDIAIFVCHGGKDNLQGFSGVFPSGGKVFRNNSDVFGKGKIAILFICHAGSVQKDLFSNSNRGLIKTLFENGFESVIAPCWALNVSIPGIWSKSFLEHLSEGIELSEAVCKANLQIKEIFITESASAVMHLFGNPHLAVGNLN